MAYPIKQIQTKNQLNSNCSIGSAIEHNQTGVFVGGVKSSCVDGVEKSRVVLVEKSSRIPSHDCVTLISCSRSPAVTMSIIKLKKEMGQKTF